MKDLIIIGGGPSGLSAAIYAARQKIDTLLLTREFGGQMAKKEVEIENYPGLGVISAQDLIGRFREHIAVLKVESKNAEVSRIKKTSGGFEVETNEGGDKEGLLEARSVLIATGSDPRLLNVKGEKEFIGRGVGYCAVCDGPLFSNKIVAVVGGGNAAFESAIFLAKFAKKIYVLEFSDLIRADRENQERLAQTGKAQVITSAQVREITGSTLVEGIIYTDKKTGKEEKISLDGVFVKVGYVPASGFAGDLVDRNDRGEIKFDPQNYMTKTPGLFVAGDVSEVKYKQIVVAAAEGAKAAMAVSEYLLKTKT